MGFDPDLVDRLTALKVDCFSGDVFRATREGADPTAPSLYGGRWSRPQNFDPGTNVLYTSFERNGAMAELASFLTSLTPVPGPRMLKVTRLSVTTGKTLRLVRADLESLGVDLAQYGERDYGRTQEIGSTLAWLGLDGLIAPSARWPCDNLMIYTDNHALTEKLEPVGDELIEWRQWAEQHGIIRAVGP